MQTCCTSLDVLGLPAPLYMQEENIWICVRCCGSAVHNRSQVSGPREATSCPSQPPALGAQPLSVCAPELSCPFEVEGRPFICLHFHLTTAQPLIRFIFLFLLLLNESLGGEERPEVWAPKGHNFLSTMVVWPSYLKQTCPRESALLGLPLIKSARGG